MHNILVIKHGALGDFIMATPAMKAIRKRHSNDNIVLLTTKLYAEMARNSGYFNEILIDSRPKLWNFFRLMALARKLREFNFTRVYDLQTSERSTRYFHLFPASIKPEWVGIAKNGSHYHGNPSRKKMHTVERQRDQLKVAGVEVSGLPDISWLKSDISRFHLPERYAVIVAGCSAHRPEKRWTKDGMVKLSKFLLASGIVPVFIGTAAEAELINSIADEVPGAINLIGQTGTADIAEIGRGAIVAAGGDTGPIHLLAASGGPTLTWFSKHSNPVLSIPRGKNVQLLKKDNLSDLQAEEVIELAKTIIDSRSENQVVQAS